jgi:hypothetical protein
MWNDSAPSESSGLPMPACMAPSSPERPSPAAQRALDEHLRAMCLELAEEGGRRAAEAALQQLRDQGALGRYPKHRRFRLKARLDGPGKAFLTRVQMAWILSVYTGFIGLGLGFAAWGGWFK